MNEKPTYELDKILSSVEPEHLTDTVMKRILTHRCLSANSLTGI